jgi:hypothetical protein
MGLLNTPHFVVGENLFNPTPNPVASIGDPLRAFGCWANPKP